MENKKTKIVGYREFYKENHLPGGKGDNLSANDVDPKELEMGMKVEKEHTDDDVLSKEIALDHLAEDKFEYLET